MQPSEVPFVSVGSGRDRKSTRLNSSHANISYAVFCLKKKKYLLLSSRSIRLLFPVLACFELSLSSFCDFPFFRHTFCSSTCIPCSCSSLFVLVSSYTL